MRCAPTPRVIVCSIAITLSLLATGCETTSKRDIGTAIGGIVGVVIGREVGNGSAGGMVVGGLVGAVVGRMIGQYMDDADRARLTETINETPRGQTVRWHNEDSQRDFAVTPTSDFYAMGEQQCRTFDQVVFVDGRRELMKGTACKSPGSDALAIDGKAV
ncbi:MAG: glycine zipper domain-containing protein [Azoarcus sp.]|nr:glycine zipper domain-containing protein [Azoarcus sp.]